MGCDIHGVLQRKIDGKWKTYREGYNDRNYNAFGILSNVRNGSGFAGIKTGDSFAPLQEEPRGFPKDFKADGERHFLPKDFKWEDGSYREKYASEDDEGKPAKPSYWMGDHSHGYVTARELAAYDFSQTRVGQGYIKAAEYETMVEFYDTEDFNKPHRSKPENGWCGGVSGPNIVTMRFTEYDQVKAKKKLPEKDIYVQVSWEESYFLAAGTDFMSFVMSVIRDAATLQDGDLDTVRFVMGYDS